MGGHYIFVLFGIPLVVIGVSNIFKTIFPRFQPATRFLIGAVFLFLPNYLATTFLFLRTAKLIAVGVSLLLIGYFLNNDSEETGKSSFSRTSSCIKAFCFSLLCTIDEQVISVILLLLGLFVLLSLMRKTLSYHVIVLLETLSFYLIYHMFWGRKLFEYFTPVELQVHPHTFQGVVLHWNEYVGSGTRMYLEALRHLTWDSEFMLSAVFCFHIFFLIKNPSILNKIISIYFVVSGWVLSIGLVTAHPKLAVLSEQSKGMYWNISVLLFIIGVLYSISSANVQIGQQLHVVESAIVMICLLHMAIILYNFEGSALNHAVRDGAFVGVQAESIDKWLADDVIKEAGISTEFLRGLICTSHDYEEYMQGLK